MKAVPQTYRATLGVAVVLVLVVFGLAHLNITAFRQAFTHARPAWLVLATALMVASLAVRAASWHVVLRYALPREDIGYQVAVRAVSIGVLLSSTSPLRLGEAARTLVLARHTSRLRRNLPAIAGTIAAQTLMNITALVVLGLLMIASIPYFRHQSGRLVLLLFGCVGLIACVGVIMRAVPLVRELTERFSGGLTVFRDRRAALTATLIQLGAWALQVGACYSVLIALHLHTSADGLAAAAVLFAVNVTAALPLTPANVGVFQAACVAVLSGIYGAPEATALAYGISLQAVEIITALGLGGIALAQEGLSLRDLGQGLTRPETE